MKRVVIGLCVVVLSCGVASGQQAPGSNYEHLKCYDQLIGSWVYDGPLLEDVPGVAGKDTKVVLRISYAWILNKSAVETVWSLDLAGGAAASGKGLTGWDVAGQRIIGGGMNSLGGYDLTTATYDAATKTWTTKGEGVGFDGKAFTSTVVVTLSDPDTLVGQATERTGGSVEGEGPKITFKRAAAPKRPRAAAQSETSEAPAPVKKSEGDSKSEPAKAAEVIK